MLVEIGAGIDHRDLAIADDIGAGAAEGERAGIARDDAADAGRTISSLPYSNENSRRNGMSTAMLQDYTRSCAQPNG